MSEEILKALMELFALILKQDGGLVNSEKEYVRRFLIQQIGVESAEEYFNLFLQIAIEVNETEAREQSQKKLTSVLDSVKILKIGKKISKTLNQRQKIVVLVRSLELINTEYKLTEQRLSILKTLADVFRISSVEYDSIIKFVTAKEILKISDEHILLIHNPAKEALSNRQILSEGLLGEILVLRVPSVELYFMQYYGSQNILLNGRPIHKSFIYLLATGSSIRIPVGLPVYYSDITTKFLTDKSSEKVLLEAKYLYYTFPGNINGIQKISFSAEQGNLIGIMGASGAGKTTLLNVLCGIYKPTDGKLTINNIDVFRDDGQLQGVLGYVPQDDLLIEELSVFDNLYFNAKFCFSDLPDHEIRLKVDDTLKSLGLFEKKNIRVGSLMNKTISGGQRKRLNIALELIREPAVLYLDEPTSGLSSRDSENVLDLLRELTIHGKLIFIVIHQPSSEIYKMFDNVIILDEGGRLVYFGNPVEAVVHFKQLDNQVNYNLAECAVCGNVNPEQIFNIIEARQVDEFGNYTDRRKVSPHKWQRIFEIGKQSEERQPVFSKPTVNLKIPSYIGQFVNYLKRDLKSKVSNRQYISLVLGVSPLLAIILSYIIRYIADPTSHKYIFRDNENIPIYIFMAIIVALFLGLIMSAEEIFRDRKILKREKFLHLSRSSYLMAKITNIMLMSALQTFIFIIIANPVLGIKGMTIYYWFALFSVAVCANLIGLIISSAFNSAVTIYILIPLIMIPMMVLSGAMFSFEKLNRSITTVNKVPVIAEAMPTRWAYEALMVKQFKDNRFESNFYTIDRTISRTNFKSAYFIPELEERLSLLNDELNVKGNIEQNKRALNVLKNEVLREQDSLGASSFNESQFNPESFNKDISLHLSDFLNELNAYYLKEFSFANSIKQDKLNTIMKDRKELYFQMLDKYHNESVAENVKKIYEKNKIVEYKGRLYQQIDPIFLLPETTRSHFYAPQKVVFGKYVDTYIFNMAVIWITTLLLYIVLYFDLLHKFIEAPVWKRKITYRLRA